MQDERDQDRQSELTALFLFFAHLGAPRGAAFHSRIISHIAGPNNFAALPGVVKQILLGVAAVFAEIAVAKFPELPRCYLSFSREILLPQHALDPDVDWKG